MANQLVYVGDFGECRVPERISNGLKFRKDGRADRRFKSGKKLDAWEKEIAEFQKRCFLKGWDDIWHRNERREMARILWKARGYAKEKKCA